MWSIFVPQQNEYTGLIESCSVDEQKSCGVELGTSGEVGATSDTFTVEYGITSLVDKKTLLQPGDRVNTVNFSCTLASFIWPYNQVSIVFKITSEI